MAKFNQIKSGIAEYIDREMLPQIHGWQKWVVGASLSMAMEKSVDIFNKLKENEFIKLMEVIDSNDNIDIDKLYKHFLAESKKGAITFKSSILGDITLDEKDVEKIYCYIREFAK